MRSPLLLSSCRFQRQEAARSNRFKRLPKLRVAGSIPVVRSQERPWRAFLSPRGTTGLAACKRVRTFPESTAPKASRENGRYSSSRSELGSSPASWTTAWSSAKFSLSGGPDISTPAGLHAASGGSVRLARDVSGLPLVESGHVCLGGDLNGGIHFPGCSTPPTPRRQVSLHAPSAQALAAGCFTESTERSAAK
jgi:hypothetical protein